MRSSLILLMLVVAAGCVGGTGDSGVAGQQFIRVRGDQLMEGDRRFRFISFNIPNLHLVEDHVPFEGTNPWRLPDRFEITDALESVRQMGGTVVRTYVLSVVRPGESAAIPRHVLGPGRFNEEAFRTLDLVLAIARDTGVRVIVPFVDNWSWWGGIAEYAGFRGVPKEAFWTDPQVLADFMETLRFVVMRQNTVTGVRYRDDPTLLCWETGNELAAPSAWTREIAEYLKSIDPNHPVMDGCQASELREESLAMTEVDIVTTHHYPGGKKSFAELVRSNWSKARGRKPYVVGEFGFVETPAMAETVEAVLGTGTAGALVWSLRFRSRDGGFYWHSEPAGGNRYKAFHWPGFQSGAAYDEIGLLTLLRRAAFELRGLPVPPVPVPAPPRMLPAGDTAHLAWQGSVGATRYIVERAAAAHGPWTAVADAVDETAAPYRPLFADTSAPPGAWYYRVRAANAAGMSGPSEAVGPVPRGATAFVDEFVDLSKAAVVAGLELRTDEARKAKEDYHRARGRAGSSLVYRLGGRLRAVRLDVFFPGAVQDFRFAVSADGSSYAPLTAQRREFAAGAGDYGYWTPARYECGGAEADAQWLKIEFQTEAQLGRIEMDWDRQERSSP
jgi:hypothetical protein